MRLYRVTVASIVMLVVVGANAEDPAKCRSNRSSAYVPSGVNISEASESMPQSIRKWLGAYAGHFKTNPELCTRLYVNSVEASGSFAKAPKAIVTGGPTLP